MKKLICLMLALIMALCLCACGGETVEEDEVPVATAQSGNAAEAGEEKPQEDAPAAAQDAFVFSYNNVDIRMNAPAEDIIAALGEAKSYTEQTSCAFEGIDKTYFYGSFYLQTYPMEEKDYVLSVWLVDDSITTAEGLFIGADQAAVEAVMGADSFDGSNVYTATKGDSKLTVIMDGTTVSSIQYDAVTG